MSVGPVFDESLSLSYLGLPEGYEPSPKSEPIQFLNKHLTQLPPHLLLHFSYNTSSKERTVIPTIRNRRLKWSRNKPTDLSFASARNEWPNLWQGRERRGIEEGVEERAWAERNFLEGVIKHVGNLGNLLGEYEEEREAERVRVLRRERGAAAALEDDFIVEEDESSDEDIAVPAGPMEVDETVEEAKAAFERLILERFIYGLLEASRHLVLSSPILTVHSSHSITTKLIGMNPWTATTTERQKSDGLMMMTIRASDYCAKIYDHVANIAVWTVLPGTNVPRSHLTLSTFLPTLNDVDSPVVNQH